MHQLLRALPDGTFELRENEDLCKYSSMNLRARGDLLLVKDEGILAKVLGGLQRLRYPYRIIGLGSNLVLPESYQGLYIKLQLPFDKSYLNQVRDEYVLPSSVPLGALTAHALKFGLVGWEVFTGIPATVGGAVFMNAGTELGEIASLLKKVELVTKEGKRRSISIDSPEGHFSYRKNHFCQEGDLITYVTIANRGVSADIPGKIRNYLSKRSATQPLDKLTCGCVFKNISNKYRAGKFLDILNLKGLEYGGIRISPVHANFMENFGQAGSAEFRQLARMVNEEMKLQFGLTFEFEVKF